MAFIHGGGFIGGAGSASLVGPVPAALNLYNGCGFSSHQGVLVATLNYRLGPLGFAAFDEGGASGNFAMKDQRLALRWLQQELPNFGGDPNKVTLFGESAGGMSVFYHVASPVSKGLFHAAISESGYPVAWGWDYGRNQTDAFAAFFGCTDTSNLKACLRKIPLKALIGNETVASGAFDMQTAQMPWQPVVDGIDMPRYPVALFKDGQTNNVPMLAGTNTNETNLFLWPFYEGGMNASQFEEIFPNIVANHDPIKALNEKEMAEVRLAYWEYDTTDDKRRMASAIATESAFQFGTYTAGQAYANKFWLYRFNHRSACQFWLNGLMPGAFHTAELQYVWGSQKGCVWTPEERSLSRRMQRMWGNFAKCHDPMCGAEGFPRYLNDSRKALVFETPEDRIEENYIGQRCSLWDRLVYEKFRAPTAGAPHAASAAVV